MHNGQRVRLGSYYGWGCIPLFWKTRGVHEPQEERSFAAVLPLMPPGATMVELGSYWAFYSMWFAQKVPGAHNFLVEPDPRCLRLGQANFALNGLSGHFTRAFVGRRSSNIIETPTISVDALCAEHDLERIHLLHADIQGYEFEMLEGAVNTLAADRVDYLFLSTHSDSLHVTCRDFLSTRSRLKVFVNVPPSASYSVDGILVAARDGLPIPAIDIALRPQHPSASMA